MKGVGNWNNEGREWPRVIIKGGAKHKNQASVM